MTADPVVIGEETIAARFVSGAATVSPTVLQLTQKNLQDLPVGELESLIAGDPEFSLRVMALANSAFYSQLREITSLRGALVVLGAKTISRLAASQLSRSLMATPQESDPSIWRHSLAAGVAAQVIAEMQQQADPQQAFVAGLLHDIGVTAILAHGDAHSDLAVHAEVGAEAAELLGLAPSLISAIRYHDGDLSHHKDDPLIATVAAANLVAIRAGFCCSAESDDDAALQLTLESLGFETEDIDALVIGLDHRLEALQAEIGTHEGRST